MHPTLIALLIGVAAGVVAALCGVGGGILMVPAFALLLGVPQKTAVATSLVAVVLAALAASFKNHTHGLIRWDLAIPAALSAGLVAWFVADALKHIDNTVLTRIFAVLMLAVGLRMLFVK